jgi:hypothetical protein
MAVHKEMIGMPVEVYANQAVREASVIIAVDDQALLEYDMPGGRTFLRLVGIDEHGAIDPDAERSVSYNRVPRKMVEAMRAFAPQVRQYLRGGFDRSAMRSEKRWMKSSIERYERAAAAVRAQLLGEV